METEQLLDDVFVFLSTMKDQYIFPRALQERLIIDNTNPTMLLDTLHEIGFASKDKNSQQSLGGTQAVYNYSLNSKGISFINKLPSDYKNKPYTYYSKTLLDKNQELVNNNALQKRINQLTLEALEREKENAELKRQLDISTLLLNEAQKADIPVNSWNRTTITVCAILTAIATIVGGIIGYLLQPSCE